MLSEADVAYIRAEFVALDDLCRARGDHPGDVRAEIEAGHLPMPSYVLDDGTEMVPADYFALVEEAGGASFLRNEFLRRYVIAAAAEPEPLDEAENEWQAYLSGEYGVCLKEVTPETIVRKSALVRRIESLLSEPEPANDAWSAALRASVDELDELERGFADYDRLRFGGPSSRERLITASRARFPAIFSRAASR
jgi:hypothetical protein